MQQEEVVEVITRRYDRFIKQLRQHEPNVAAEEFAKLFYWLRRSHLKISPQALAAFAEVWIDLFWQCHCYEMMLKVADDAQAMFGEDAEWIFARGEALFNLGRFEESRQALEPLTTEDFDDPMLYYLLACLAERRGQDEEARGLFETANRLNPEDFAIPVPLSEEEAIAVYEQCMVELPDPIAWRLKEVPLFVSPLPSDELILSTNPPIDPLILGLFIGQSHGAETSSWPSDQPRILLFHKNIAKIAGDFETIEEELRKTLFHEVGHFLGVDESQLEEMGLG